MDAKFLRLKLAALLGLGTVAMLAPALAQSTPAPRIEVGRTTTAPPGSKAQVKARTEGDTMFLDFAIPRGFRGQRGPRGPQGTPGVSNTATPPPLTSGVRLDPRKAALLQWWKDYGTGSLVLLDFAPSVLCFDGSNMWVGEAGAYGNVAIVDTVTGAVRQTFATGSPVRSMCWDGLGMWVQTDFVVRRYGANGVLLSDQALLSAVPGMCYDGAHLWAPSPGSLSVYNTGGDLLQSYSMNNGNGLGRAIFDGTSIWFDAGANWNKVRRSDGVAVSYPNRGPREGKLVFDGERIWQIAPSGVGAVDKTGSSSLVYEYTDSQGHIRPFKTDDACYDGETMWLLSKTGELKKGFLRQRDGVTLTVSYSDDVLQVGPNTGVLAFDGSALWVGVGNGVLKIW